LEKLQEKRLLKTADSSNEGNKSNSRGIETHDQMLELVRETSESNIEIYKFNDMTDHDITVTPSAILEELNIFNQDYFEDNSLVFEHNFEK
jgi:hypothetical protein